MISRHLYNEPTCQLSCEYLKRFLSYHPDKHTLLKICFWSCDFSDWLKCHDTIFRHFCQGYFIHLPNMKRVRLIAAKLLRKENADPVESLFLHTNKAKRCFGPLAQSHQRHEKCTRILRKSRDRKKFQLRNIPQLVPN